MVNPPDGFNLWSFGNVGKDGDSWRKSQKIRLICFEIDANRNVSRLPAQRNFASGRRLA
jgi:hypothetical protein